MLRGKYFETVVFLISNTSIRYSSNSQIFRKIKDVRRTLSMKFRDKLSFYQTLKTISLLSYTFSHPTQNMHRKDSLLQWRYLRK